MIFDELRHPIVQAPMAGGPSTPELAIAVCAAGGLGFLAAGYLSVEAMQADIAAVRVGTTAPFGVNLFVPSVLSAPVDEQALQRFVDRLDALLATRSLHMQATENATGVAAGLVSQLLPSPA